uniref:Pre-rRNA-processing protein n=1 Tax=Schizophyllum commune (strain H4-8 / FGSC 9210) TaxID=578458 RepID=D8PQT0_SCHCM
MPKATKRKKEKAADFSKAKLKLGKGKQAPTNAVDTSFKARSIALPNQSIAVEKDGDAPTTKRRHTLDDLLAHLKHYNAGTRRDALMGLRELLNEHSELIVPSLTSLVNACVRVIADEDASVRKALLSFMSWLIPLIPVDLLAPHASVLILFASSAQTHIFPEIRVDAVRFINLFLEYVPDAMVTGWNQGTSQPGGRVLEGYLGILSAGTKFGDNEGPMQATSTASVVLTPGSRLIILQSLSLFLKRALSLGASSDPDAPGAPFPTWYLASSFRDEDAHHKFDAALAPGLDASGQSCKKRSWIPEADKEYETFVHEYPLLDASSAQGWSIQDLDEALKSVKKLSEEASSTIDVSFVTRLARTLHATLVATYLDYAPAVFGPTGTPSETELQLVMTVVDITRTLYGAIFQSESALQKAFQDLNLYYCELASLIALATGPDASSQTRRSKKKDTLTAQTERVRTYIIQLLHGEPVAGQQLARALSPSAYTALLPTVWSLLNAPEADDVLAALLDHAISVPSKTPLKLSTVAFVGRLVLLDYEHGPTRVRGLEQQANDWIEALPRVLWEVGGSNPTLSEIIARILLRLAQRRPWARSEALLQSLRSKLAPFFIIAHPAKGKLPGPYAKLPATHRHLVLEAVAALAASNGNAKAKGRPVQAAPLTADALALLAAVDEASAGADDAIYWAHLKVGLKLGQ